MNIKRIAGIFYGVMAVIGVILFIYSADNLPVSHILQIGFLTTWNIILFLNITEEKTKWKFLNQQTI